MESLTIGRLLKELRPGQLWALLVAAFTLVSGSFLLGYKLQQSKGEFQADKATAKLAEFRGLQTKEKFLALYLRYLIAKGCLETEASEENRREADVARDAYFEYVNELRRRGEEAEDEINLRGVVIGKGGGKDVTVKFGYDGSVWPLPRELGLHTAS